MMRIMRDPQINVKENVKKLTSLRGSPHDICCCSSFCSSFRAPIDCWFLTKSESSLSPASVKYLAKCSQLRLFAGNNSWKNAHRSRFRVKQAFFTSLCSFSQAWGVTITWGGETNSNCAKLVSLLYQTISRAHRLNGEQQWSKAGLGPHHEPVVHANLSKTGSNRADVLFWKPGFEEFHCEARRNTWINAMRTRHVLPTDLQG